MNSKLLKLFKEHIHFPEDYTKVCWTEGNYEVSYNKNNNVEDLMQGEADTYSGEIKSCIELDGYVMFNLDSGCGWDYQAIFSCALKVDEDKYWGELDE